MRAGRGIHGKAAAGSSKGCLRHESPWREGETNLCGLFNKKEKTSEGRE